MPSPTMPSGKTAPDVPDTASGGAKADRPLRVLVADDNELTTTSLSMLLELEGFEVATALDGEQALARADAFRPDVALIDIGMPRLSGHEVAHRIRSAPWGRKMMLIALTGWNGEGDRTASLNAGFDRHVGKPVDFSEILACLPAADEGSAAPH